MTEREFATEVVERLQRAGFQALFAGGCVRDELLGRVPADYDIATSARPDELKPLFRKCNHFGASFGVVEVLGPRGDGGEWLKVQVATFRTDGAYSDGRRPDAVVFSSPEEDAARRDFTINGLFFDPVAGHVIDYVDGRADLEARILRAIGDPTLRFAEDKLRLMRAARMAARFELALDPATAEAARAMAPQIRVVSAERIAEELRKMFENEHRLRGVELLRDLGLLKEILPEAKADPDAIRATLNALPKAATFPLVLVAISAGVPAASFPVIAQRLKLSNEERDRVVWLAKNRTALENAAETPRSKLFPILAHAGGRDLVALAFADAAAQEIEPAGARFADALLRQYGPTHFDPPPLLTGDDLQAMGLKPGKHFKTLLDAVRALQFDGEVNSADEAREKVLAMMGPRL